MQLFESFKIEIVGADSEALCTFFNKVKGASNLLLLLISAASSFKKEVALFH